MPTARAILDANVLYQAPLRDTLLSAAESGLFEPYWSAAILAEVERNLIARFVRQQASNPHERWQHLAHQLAVSFPIASVVGYEALILNLENDPKDRHVLAAAIHCGATTIVTHNLRDFPAAALQPHQVSAMSPDDFLLALFSNAPIALLEVVIMQGTRLRHPRPIEETLAQLQRHAPRFVHAVHGYVPAT